MKLPVNADKLIAQREAGHHPKRPVMVSAIGPLAKPDAACLMVRPGERYDWRCLIGCDVVYVAETSVPAWQVKRHLADLVELGYSIPTPKAPEEGASDAEWERFRKECNNPYWVDFRDITLYMADRDAGCTVQIHGAPLKWPVKGWGIRKFERVIP